MSLIRIGGDRPFIFIVSGVKQASRNFLRSTGLDLITNYRLPIPNSQFPIPNKYKTMFLDAGKHGL
jgi:hypothetical protein